MSQKNRALHHRRTKYVPGFGVCSCATCKAAWKESQGRADMPAYGSPVPGCLYVNPEMAFAEAWEKECRPCPGINYGHGLVQDLMVVHRADERSVLGLVAGRMAFWLTVRERVIAATVVQWLGTNCGMAFLGEVLRRCGMLIVQDETKTERYAGMQAQLLNAAAATQRARKDADDSKAAYAALLKKHDELVAGVARVSGCPVIVCAHDVLAQVERLTRERDAARAVLARLNLETIPAVAPLAVARFAGLGEGEEI